MGKEIVNQVQEALKSTIQDKSKEKHTEMHINQTIKKLNTKKKY